MRVLVLFFLLGSACRRKHVPPPVVPAPPAEVESPVVVAAEPPPPPPAAAGPSPTGHAPTDEELRERLRPILPAIAGCVARLRPEGPVVLRFAVSPATGGALAAELAGRSDECAAQALSALHFEPWSGPPSVVELPLTREGQTMVQTDAGLK